MSGFEWRIWRKHSSQSSRIVGRTRRGPDRDCLWKSCGRKPIRLWQRCLSGYPYHYGGCGASPGIRNGSGYFCGFLNPVISKAVLFLPKPLSYKFHFFNPVFLMFSYFWFFLQLILNFIHSISDFRPASWTFLFQKSLSRSRIIRRRFISMACGDRASLCY